MKKAKVFYWKDIDNFGDVLNLYLVNRLGKYGAKYFNALTKKQVLKQFVKTLFLQKRFDKEIISSFKDAGTGILAIGSVLSRSTRSTTVWGSGFMNENESCVGGNFLAVRGKESYRRLKELGFDCNPQFGDPALLLPLIYKPKRKVKYKLGIIPHWREFETFNKKYSSSYRVINLITKDIENVVDQIASCEYILSTSLHGIIVAHAYSIPALWIKEGYIDTDGFKFKDYFSSVGISSYEGYNIKSILNEEESIDAFFKKNADISKINNELLKIQQSLLRVAPFQLKIDFKHKMLQAEVAIDYTDK